MKPVLTTVISATALAFAGPALAAAAPSAKAPATNPAKPATAPSPATPPTTAAPATGTTDPLDQGATDSTAPATQADTATTSTTTTTTTASSAATAKAGDTVYDSTGVPAGTIESVSATSVVLVTSAGKATVPLSGLSNGPKGPTIAMTKTQLEEAIRKAKG